MKSKYKQLTVLLIIFFWNCEQTDFDLQTSPDAITIGNIDHDLVITGILDRFCREQQDQYFSNIGRFVRYIALDGEYIPSHSGAQNRFRTHWTHAYDTGKNIQLIINEAENDESLVFHRGIAKLIWVFNFANMVDLHGDVPYSQALDPIVYPQPGVDKGADIYADLYNILDEAMADFERAIEKTEDQTLNGITEAADLMFEGDIDSWIRLGNSLKLRLLVQTRLVNAEDAKTQIDLLIEKDRFLTAEHDFDYKYGEATSAFPSHHPFYEDTYLDKPDYLTNHFIYALKDSKVDDEGESIPDPRIRYYLYRQTKENDLDAVDYCWDPLEDPNLIEGFNYCYLGDFYLGKDHGYQGRIDSEFFDIITLPGAYPVGGAPDNSEGVIRHQSNPALDGKGINPILNVSFINFYKAEAALTLGTAGDPKTYLRQALEASIEKTLGFDELSLEFTPSSNDIDDYIEAVMEAYEAAATDQEKLEVIINEFYLAAWGNPLEIYNAYRRTGFPNFPPPISSSDDVGDFPRSLPWPKTIVEGNPSFEGTNKPETEQVFWDTNPANFIK